MDWGFLTGLSGRKNWDAIDAQKGKDLQYQYLLNNMQDQHLKETQDNIAHLQDIYQKANDIEVLEPGRDRIKGVSDKLKDSIKEKIKAYGGDFEKYMKVEGMPDAKNYVNQLLNDPTTIKEMHNARYVAQNKADLAAGLLPRIDPTTGKTFNEAMTDYYAGKTDVIPYYGAFKPGKFDDKYFSENYANEKKTPKSVEADEYFTTGVRELINQGLTPQDAAQQLLPSAKAYQAHIQNGGNKLQYKSEKQPSELDTKIKEERYEIMRNKNLANIKNASDSWQAITSGENAMGVQTDDKGNKIPPVMNVDEQAYQNMFGAPPQKSAKGEPISGYLPTPLSETDKKAMATLVLGTSADKKQGGYVGRLLNGDKVLSAHNLQPLTGNINDHKFVIKDIDHTITIPPPPGSNQQPKTFVLVHADIPNSDAGELGIWEHNTIFPDRANKASEGSGRQGITTEGKLGRVFPLLIPIDNVPLNLREAFTKKVTLGTLSNQDIEQYMNDENEPVSSDEETQ